MTERFRAQMQPVQVEVRILDAYADLSNARLSSRSMPRAMKRR
jgi:hypothetical protein